jgi:hypothetical protein
MNQFKPTGNTKKVFRIFATTFAVCGMFFTSQGVMVLAGVSVVFFFLAIGNEFVEALR